jgi:23S rRNA pseudouridine1911/1915/1917 synthase
MTADALSPLASRVLYVSERYLVINKLPGEAAEGAGPGITDLPRLLTEQYGAGGQGGTKKQGGPGRQQGTGSRRGTGKLSGQGGRFFPVTAVHRLDVPVSGCVLFARTPGALRAASALFAGEGEAGVEKRYWAVVEAFGNVPDTAGLDPDNRENTGYPASVRSGPLAEKGELVHWIYRDGRRNKSVAFDAGGSGRKQGILRYRIAGRGERYLFLEIELVTGRSHQIRAQLAALGLHIKGDLKYGAKRSERNGGIRLHARSLAFQDPLTGGEIIRAVAPPPIRDRLWEDFENCAAGNPHISS